MNKTVKPAKKNVSKLRLKSGLKSGAATVEKRGKKH